MPPMCDISRVKASTSRNVALDAPLWCSMGHHMRARANDRREAFVEWMERRGLNPTRLERETGVNVELLSCLPFVAMTPGRMAR